MALVIALWAYWQDYFTGLLSLENLFAGSCLLAVSTLITYYWSGGAGRIRAGSSLDALSGLLSELSDTESPRDIFEQIMTAPVGSDRDKLPLGWNRLVNAFDTMYQEMETLKIAKKTIENYGIYDTQRFATIIDQLPDGILMVDAQGTIVMANRRCEGLINRSAGELIGSSFQMLINDELCQETLERFWQAQQPEIQFESSQGEGNNKVVLRFYAIKVGQQTGNVEMMILIRDITQHKIAENAQSDFIAHVSHELRTPLTNIRAYAETLLSDMVLDASAQKEAFNVINDETIRLTNLINDVLDLSRMETGMIQLERGEVVLDRLVRQCVNDIKGMAATKSITVQTNFHPKLPNLYADREKLAVVMNNILSNAIKYTPEGGTVFVETNTDENYVYFKVTDTGYGIAPEDQEKIFEKFYRVERDETAEIIGTGLGLATCQELVHAHGGSITVNSQLNNGTEMLVKLPLTKVGPVLGPNESMHNSV